MKKDFKILNIDNSEISTTSFEVDSDIENSFTDANIAYVIRWQLAKRRSGSAKVKAMSEISGTTAKPWKQKGTGRARQGSRRSVQFVGGRTCHGPTPRSFDFSIPKKIVAKALLDSFFTKIKDNSVIILDGNLSNIKKSSTFASALKSSNINSALCLVDSTKEGFVDVARATRNIKNVKTLDIGAINVYDILKHQYLLIDIDSFKKMIQSNFGEK